MAVEKYIEVQAGINAGMINPPPGVYATTGAVVFTNEEFASEYDKKIREAGLPLHEIRKG